MIRIIVAVDAKNGIAKQGVQPWSLPGDEAYFSRMTKSRGAKVLMGHRTFEVIGKPLANRRNIVVSNSAFPESGIEMVSDITGLLLNYTLEKDIWVIGGEKVYEQAIIMAKELYITKINTDFKCDQFFPAYESLFSCTYQSEMQEENGLTYCYTHYAKIQ
jgi:dihydrofolate reductase